MKALEIKNPLGKTGLKIPPIIFGTSALGNLYVALDDAVKTNIIKECMQHVEKPVVFDSAGKYGAGLALEKLGEILNNLKVPRDNVIISNKLGWIRKPLTSKEPTFEPGVWKEINFDAYQEISYEGILKCFDQGNKLLGSYRPDLVSVHDPDEYVNQSNDESNRKTLYKDILDAYKALIDLKKQGKIRAVGVGAKDWKIIEQIYNDVELDWVMFANSMTIMRHPPELIEFMEKLYMQGVGIINSAVFHAGFLTGGDYFDYKLIKPDSDENKEKFIWREKFFRLCKSFQIIPSNACVAFALTSPGVISISLNTSNPERVKMNVESVSTNIPKDFWLAMKREKLIHNDYQYLGI